jgi:hypothetical protein
MQDLGFNASNMEVKVLIKQQVPEIAQVCRTHELVQASAVNVMMRVEMA